MARASRPATSTSSSPTTTSPARCILQLEDLGFCAKGRGRRVRRGRPPRPGGGLPTMTTGGGLSYCHPGALGILLLVEAVRQLRGEAGDRQVPGCRDRRGARHRRHLHSTSPRRWCSPVTDAAPELRRSDDRAVLGGRGAARAAWCSAAPACGASPVLSAPVLPRLRGRRRSSGCRSAGTGTVYSMTTVHLPVDPALRAALRGRARRARRGTAAAHQHRRRAAARSATASASTWRERDGAPPLPVFAPAGGRR